MSAPIVWIILPLSMAIFLLAIRKWEKVCIISAASLCLFLAALALVLTIDQPIKAGPIQFTLQSELPVLGRKFVLSQTDLPVSAFLFGVGAFWFLTSLSLKNKIIYVPIGLSVIAILIASLAVKPFLYGALLIEVAVLACIPLLIDPLRPSGNGVLRFLIFQTLGMPFLLLAGWFLASGEITPINETQLTQSALILGLGFAFWLGLFPFHTWIPMIAQEASPGVSGFIFSIFPLPVTMFLLDFLNSYAWLRDFPAIFPAFRWLGAIMVFVGGLWCLFQQNIKQILGYLVIVLSGVALLALGIKGAFGVTLLAYSFLPRFLAIALLSLSISFLISKRIGLRVDNLHGLVRKAPFTTLGLAIAILSSSGMPLLAGYPVIQSLAIELSKISPVFVVMLLSGLVCIFFCGFRLLSIMFEQTSDEAVVTESLIEKLGISLLAAAIFILGMLPSLFHSLLINLINKFPFLLL